MPRVGRRAAALLLAAGAVLSGPAPAFAQPAAPTGFEVEQAGSIKAKLAWNEPASGSGIDRHEVRFRAGSAAFPDAWTPIPFSAPGQPNAAGYVLSGLTAETAYDFELRAVTDDVPGAAASASATTLVPFTARFSPLKTWYEGDEFTMTIAFTAPIGREVVRDGVLVQNGRVGGVRAGDDAATWHVLLSGIRSRRDVTVVLLAASDCDETGVSHLCSTLGEPLTEGLNATVRHRPSLTLAVAPAAIAEDGGETTVTASLDKDWHEDVTVAVSASPVAPATASDFSLSATTLTIDEGDRTGAVTLTAVDNDVQAADKDVTVSGAVTPDYIPAPDAVTLIIRDDDAAAPAPTGFAVSAGSTTAELSWDRAPKGVTITAHEVRYRAGDDDFPDDWTAIADSAPGEANATGYTVRGLSPATDYDFELRVVNDSGSSNAATASATTLAAFTARFETIPDTHDGTRFTVRIHFSADLASAAVVEGGVELTGGANTDVTRVDGRSDLFDYEVRPSGVGDVTITLPAASGCSNGDICNAFDEPLTAELAGTVAFLGVQPRRKLVANVDKTLDTGTLPAEPSNGFIYAQSFTTGTNETGYKLDRIGIQLADVDAGDAAAVSLLSADVDGEPDTELYPLTRAHALRDGAMNYFSAPHDARLTKETRYYLQVTGAGRSEFRVRIVGGTDETEEDADSAADWSIGDDLRERRTTSEWITTPKVMKIRVDGRVLSELPTVFLGLEPATVAESGAATVTAAALPASDTAFTVEVSASPVSPATSSDFSLSSNTRLSFAADATASTGTVTVTAADDAVETADRKVTVSGEVSAAGVAGPDDVELTILDDDAELFTAEFSEIPETHDGQTAFTVKIRFSADIAGAATLAQGVELTGGTAGSVTRVGSASDHWNYPVTPAGDKDVYIALPVPSGCDDAGDLCSADGVRLATVLVGRVAGPESQDPPDGGAPTAPAPPTNFGANHLDGAVRLFWRAPVSDGGSEILRHDYRQRIDEPGGGAGEWLAWSAWTAIPDSTPGGQNGESFTVTDLENERFYQFELRAVNAIGSTASMPSGVEGFPDEGLVPRDLSLTPSPPDPSAVFSRAEYTVTFDGDWTTAATPDGVPAGAHFSRLVGGVHNGDVVFVTDGTHASPGVESMAELGGTTSLKAEIQAAGADHLSVLEGTTGSIDPTASESFTGVALTTDHPRVTLLTMVAPSPDWFVGVSGLSMLDSLGGWRPSRTVTLHPFDAGTEEGTGFSLTNDDTVPPEFIASLVGKGKFSAEPIATLTFTRTSVTSAPSAPTGLAVTPGDASVTLAWTAGADGGSAITRHQVRYRTGAAYPPTWTDIPESAAGGTNAGGFTVTNLTNGVSHSFQVRALNTVGAGPAATSGAATPMPAVVPNAAPAFDSPSTFTAAENQTTAGTVQASDGDADDSVTGYAITGGADGSAFSIGATSGVLTFNAAPNYEAPSDTDTNGSYVVVVQATSGAGTRVRTATQTITVTVTDVGGEAPGKPAAPTVTPASVSSLTVNWSAPDNAGPAITDYDVQYREGNSGGWTDGNYTGTATTATLSGLSEDTSHQVQVRATNDEGTGGWSASGSGSTLANAPPAFDSPATFSVEENRTEVGMVRASDADSGDNVTGYARVGGADRDRFVLATSGALSFVSSRDYEDAEDTDRNNTYVVEVEATSGTGEREKTATQTITVMVTDAVEPPQAPTAPTVTAASATSLTVTWSAPDNDGPAITDYDHRHRTSPAGSWTEVTGTTSTALSATIAGLADGTSYDVQVRATNDEGTGDWSDSGTESTAANAAPTFDSSATFSAAENQTTAGTVEASDSDTGDNVTGYEITGGADRAFFSIGATSGALTFDAAPNFEDAKDIVSVDPANAAGNNQYVVVVTATSGAVEREKTATQTITVTVTDAGGEAPAAPAAPTVTAASATSLTVTWSAPANDGPAITDYDYRHRTSPDGSWTEVTDTAITALSATIAGLADGTSYDVQVRATNDEGTGDWSDSGTESTDANAAPSFDSSATFSAAENQTVAGTVRASDSDTGDDITGYEITGGADQGFFSIGATSGALTFDAAPNFEDAKDIVSVDPANAAGNNQYVVVVTATSGAVEREKTATQTITVTVTDAGGEAPAAPAAPTVTAASATSLTVTWSAPANDGPAITDYDYRHRTSPDGSWTEVTDTAITALSATITGLADGTSYDVQVRATNDEGTGDWSDSGTESTDANAAPSFDSSATFSAAENQTVAGTVRASDSDTDDNITGYALTGGADRAFFSIGATSGALTFDAAPNFEDAKDIESVDPANAAGNNQYVVVVTATSGAVEREKTATQTITVTVTDAGGEAPGKPAAPNVSAASATSLTVTWSAPANDGPAITDYDYRHRTSPDGSWTEVTDTAITALSATITGLADGTAYDVQVRATNDEGTGDWSDSGTDSTDANAAPSFDSSATFSAAENQTVAGTVRASDSDTDDNITGYALTGGADRAFFSIGATSGALTFDAAPNFEDAKDIVSVDPANAAGNNQYVVVVTATSGAVEREKTATQTITVTVTDVGGEAPDKPAAPNVSAASATSLNVNWSAPDNAGPAITDYDHRHRTASPEGNWTEVTGATSTALSATIAGLADGTAYDVQVRATNDEGTGAWSDSGTESTDANAAPAFSSSATFDAAENQTVAGTVEASDSDTGDNITGYEITGGADQGAFSIGSSSGELTFDAAPNFEDAKDQNTNNQYVVVVTATSGAVEREKTATQTITVTVTDVSGEAPGKPAAPTVSAASATSLSVSWSAPANAGPAITDYDHRHRTSPAGSWTEVAGTASTALSATIAGLADGTAYDVQVRATNDEGTGAWSDSGTESTDANAAPAFDSPSTFNAAENQTTAGTVEASDSDTGDDITGYAITGGADRAFFSIGATDGALTFDAAPNYEDAKDQDTGNTYVVVVTATSGADEREKTATQTITVTVTDVGDEAPGKPAAPNVSAASATSLTVTWAAPDNAGPAITDYDVQYRAGTSGDWTDAGHNGTAITATLTGLAEDTSHQVQVRATNDEGTGDWSDSGSGATDANAAPSFSSSATFDAAENQTAAGTVVASDSDSEDKIERYDITGGADQALFMVIASSGDLEFRDAPNFEDAQDQDTNNQYVVTVQATSGTGTREKTATQTITVTVTDAGGEPPGEPAAPNVSSASVTSLAVNWSAPDNAGPAITDYDVQYRAGTSGDWTDAGHNGTAITATLTGLAEDTSHQVQVRATNDEGTGAWSDSGSGATDANAAPAFSSDAAFDAAENGTEVTMVRAEDSDSEDKIERYDITGGADQAFFLVIASSGHLEFRDAPNFEDAKDQGTNNTYVVEVQATSGTGTREKTATQTITVTVTDVAGEKPAAPSVPMVSAASVTSLNVRWSAPANHGPAITDYDHRHRTASPEGNWTEVTGTTSTDTTATIAGLADGTSYDVQVRATNGEGTGAWSDSGTGSTDASPLPDTPALDVAMVQGDELELRFDRLLDESSVPAPEDFTVVLDDGAGTSLPGVGRYAGSGARGRPLAASAAGVRGTTLAVTAVEVRGAAVVLTLDREVPHGMRVTVSYTPGAAPLRDRQGMAVPPLGNEAAVETALSVADALADEGDDVTFPVTLSPAVASAVTVDWFLTPGSAAPGTDYTGPLAGSLTIEGGETAGVIAVPTAEDAAVESTETFTLTLTEPADFPHWALLKTATATGTIRDDDFDTGGTSGGTGTGGGSGSGSGGSGGSRDRPPVATDEIGTQVLERGGTVTLDASQHFRDPERRTLTFTAASADPAVATVSVDGAAVTITGLDHGHTRVTLTATDRRRQQATQEFEVRVGRTVSFADAALSAPEGGTVELTVTVDPALEEATTLSYVVGADADPATVDADDLDHAGRDGTVTLAAGATAAALAIAIHDDADIEAPRETFAVTLLRTAEQAERFGLGAATARVTILEGVCDRTAPVRNTLRRSLPCAAVSAADLAALRAVDLSERGLAALRGRDLSGLTGLRVLDLSENLLAALPAGLFEGLGALDELRLQDNPGASFALTVQLAREDAEVSAPGPARVHARLAEGAPLDVRVGVMATNATLSSDALHLAAGALASAPLTVTPVEAGAARLTPSVPALPDTRCGLLGLYRCYRGVTLTAGAPLVLFKAPPRATGEAPRAELGTDGDALRIDLSDLFAASDGGALTYMARSGDPGLVSVHVAGGVLTVTSTADGADGTVTVTVTATDADGLSTTRTFEVTVEPMPGGLMRGWRRVLLIEGAAAEGD